MPPEERGARSSWLLRLLRPVVSLLLAGLLLWLAVRDVDLDSTWSALRAARIGWIGVALFSVALNTWAKAARWGVILGDKRDRVTFRLVLTALLIGQTVNWFIPGRWGELSRAHLIGHNRLGKTFSLGTVALEKIIDLAAYALLFTVLLLMLPLPAWLSDSGFTLVAISAVLVAGVGLVAGFPLQVEKFYARILALVPEKIQPKILVRIQSGLASLEVLGRGREMLKVSLLTALIWATAIWNIDLAAKALRMDISLIAALTVLVVLQAGVSIPVIPGRFGLFQYLCILALGLFGIGETTGLTFGILLQAVILIPPTIVSLLLFLILGLYRDNEPKEHTPD